MQPRHILITGGHIAPALAVIDELQAHHPQIKISCIGRRYVNSREHADSFEYTEVTRRNITFYHLDTARSGIADPLTLVATCLRFISAVRQSFRIIAKVQPDCVLSFGGYIALPVALAAWFRHIDIYTHEQTIVPGRANRILGRMAKQIFVSFPESIPFLPTNKVIVTGNPLRKAILETTQSMRLPSSRKQLFITGGSLGSHSVNVLIEEILPELLGQYAVIHQTGNVAEYGDFERLSLFKTKLPRDLSTYYTVFPHCGDDQIGQIYSSVDLVIGRAGANTFFDLLALQKPAILIPLPWAAFAEQQRQAELFAALGIGEIFDQYRSPHELLLLIQRVVAQLDRYHQAYVQLAGRYTKRDAAQQIVSAILNAE